MSFYLPIHIRWNAPVLYLCVIYYEQRWKLAIMSEREKAPKRLPQAVYTACKQCRYWYRRERLDPICTLISQHTNRYATDKNIFLETNPTDRRTEESSAVHVDRTQFALCWRICIHTDRLVTYKQMHKCSLVSVLKLQTCSHAAVSIIFHIPAGDIVSEIKEGWYLV